MKYDYRTSEEGIRRFENKEAYEISLKYQSDMAKLGIAVHNHFSDECTIDFSCCCGNNIDGFTDYEIYIPSYRTAVKLAFDEVFEIIKHGDDEHKRWLKIELEKYIKNNF